MASSSKQVRIVSLFPHFSHGLGNSHTATSVCENLIGPGVDVELIVPAAANAGRRPFVTAAVPDAIRSVAYKLSGGQSAPFIRAAEQLFLSKLKPGDIAYVWPGASLQVYREVKARGLTLVIERWNSHTAHARDLLDREYQSRGWAAAHGITSRDIEVEAEELRLADFVYSPSPMVEHSLLKHGVNRSKILTTSYGYDPARLGEPTIDRPQGDGLTVAFVGTGCVRKGLHVLLQAWHEARTPGRLLLAGKILDDIKTHCADLLDHPSVFQLGHVSDVSSVYRLADVFAFPSLEEGGPLVTYEAMASGCVPVVSPAGAGRVALPGVNSLIFPTSDVTRWANAFSTLAADVNYRHELATAAMNRAQMFTWARVGRQRRVALVDALGKLAVPRAYRPEPIDLDARRLSGFLSTGAIPRAQLLAS